MCGRHSGERVWWLVVAFVVGPGIGCGAGTPAAANGSCGAFIMPNTASAGLPHSASYTANGDGTVTDNVTGFLWEGTLDPGQYTQPDAAAYCAGKGGLWRLPSKLELISLVDLDFAPSPSMQPPAIDPAYFPDTPPDFFWSSTLYADETLGEPFAWYVFFQTGFVNYMPTSGMARVRCVSAQSTCVAHRYQFQDEGLVYDRATTLTWQRSAEGGRVSWEEAKSYCAARGPGWRLPSLTELTTTSWPLPRVHRRTTEHPRRLRSPPGPRPRWASGTPRRRPAGLPPGSPGGPRSTGRRQRPGAPPERPAVVFRRAPTLLLRQLS